MRTLPIFALALVVFASVLMLKNQAAFSSPTFVVIVHPDNPTTSLNRKFLVEAFLKKTTRWDNGDVIHPVDQGPDSPVRQRFSEDVLRRSVAAVRSYWQQIVFSGQGVPPPELGSDEDVVRYVLKHAGAVGYVSGSANMNGTKIVGVY